MDEISLMIHKNLVKSNENVFFTKGTLLIRKQMDFKFCLIKFEWLAANIGRQNGGFIIKNLHRT